jgi:uncharacterized membrane protein YkvA (DUF1232 family)
MNQEPMPAPAGAPQGDSRLQELWRLARHVVARATDPRVPLRYKAIPALAVLYVLSPIDLVPDTIPIVTQLDDIAVLLIAARMFVSLTDRCVTSPANEAPDTTTVATSYHVREE